MRKAGFIFIVMSALVWAAASWAAAAEESDLATDITKEVLVGPGSVQVATGKDILMSFGAQIRMIPTSETAYDFGMSEKVSSYLGGVYSKDFFKDHLIESGWVNHSYIRSEDRLYFNAMPKDRKWSFYAALEFDRALETSSVDSRGGKSNNDSNFGLERVQGTMALPLGMRLHAGWDIWQLDVGDGAGLVYGDDNPGFWLTGGDKALNFNVGYFKLVENNFQASAGSLNNASDDDRTLYAGHLTWRPAPGNKFKFFGAYDRIRSAIARDFTSAMTSGAFGTSSGRVPDVDSYHAGLFYVGKFGGLQLFAEGVYQFGTADNTGLAKGDYDINAYAFAGDVSYKIKGDSGLTITPHAGFMYTSGDDDPNDDELGGYTGVTNANRFSRYWGGENTIVGDTNLVFGSIVYGYLPEFYGNGTPVGTGGLAPQLGSGRGDNPGLTMYSLGLTLSPAKYLVYKTNANIFSFNEDFQVFNWVTGSGYTTVDAGYMGTEWDNELTFAMSKHTFLKGQASVLFPGSGLEDVTQALGAKSDDRAVRFALELIWNF
ncbi:MAG: autotransporter outer membrane beta-barrel domain-containing protein [Deltaproteobacteria bacterium]|nr:autotransporter outer membrane beta-barrel domain-containing protein [Deltaproteobacteria bacterium]MBW2050431.1 autotransporter outer membrane beta-barrel domain-containing protein [Deltaproteobacteria bacterium]MBW2102875.1 autotransporter outer membrane beta-barrel domain-containing protein [Deltaproteobacteria bacterium]